MRKRKASVMSAREGERGEKFFWSNTECAGFFMDKDGNKRAIRTAIPRVRSKPKDFSFGKGT